MTDRPRPEVADGQPFAGDVVAVVDESVHEAGGGVYYVVGAAVVVDPTRVTAELRALIKERSNVVHWAREGPAMRTRVLDVLCESAVAASVQWSATGRRGQIETRARLLTEIATWVYGEGADHLVIESSDTTMNRRDRQTLARHPMATEGGLVFRYDHRSKQEPLLWLADTVASAVGEHLIGKGSGAYERLVEARLLPPL